MISNTPQVGVFFFDSYIQEAMSDEICAKQFYKDCFHARGKRTTRLGS
jgi:hypothetical protein